MKTYEDRIAYRHGNGEVEGFRGVGPTKKVAREDAMEQVRRKIEIIRRTRPDEADLDKSRVVTSPSTLTRDELATVQADWNSGVRY